MSLTNTDVCWPCVRIQRQSAVISPQHESSGVMRRRPCPPCLRPSSSSSILRTWLCMWPSTKQNPSKSRFQLRWGLECNRSALDLFNYKVLPLPSTHSGSHGCDFDRVFTKCYKWADNMWTPGIFPEAYFQSKRSDMNAIEKLPLCWSEPFSICGRFYQALFLKHYFISLNPSRLIFPFVAWLRGVWQGAKRVKQVQPGRVPSSQLWK